MLAGCSSLTRQTTGATTGSAASSPWWAQGDSLAADDTARTAVTRTVGDTLTADANGPVLLADASSGAGLDSEKPAEPDKPAEPEARPIEDSTAGRLSPEALAALREAYATRTDVERDRVRGVNEYAIWCVTNGMWDEARIHLEQAMRRDSLSASLNNNLGIIYERMGQRDEARIRYQKAADLNPGRRLYEANLRRLHIALEAPVSTRTDSLAAEELLLPRSRGERRQDVGVTPNRKDEADREFR